MELFKLLNRAKAIGDQRPAFDPKQRMATAAAELNLAGTLQAQLGVCEAALRALIAVLYATDGDDQPANIDAVTGRILIPLPWGNQGWKRWGLRKWEAACLRKLMLERAQLRRPLPLFCFDASNRQWFLDMESYVDEEAALLWLQVYGPQLGEWRTVVEAWRVAEAERLQRTP